MTKKNEKHYEVPTINNKAEYLEFKENIKAHDSFNAIDDENMALELHIGQSIVEFYKPKYERK
tara:strand:+ start:703 stop:891 length:189 start_codon:yes stop_codon:yes gene_type:complete